jgi:transposase-like protein
MTSRTKSNLASMPAGPQEATVTKAQEQRRQRAINRYLAGDPIEDICRELACSKSWLYKWRDRYLATDPSWSAERSRSPTTNPTNTPQRIAQIVVALRQTLAQHGKGCGAASIQQALEQQGIVPVPSPRTIYRILHRYDKEVDLNQPPSSIRPSAGNFCSVLTGP